MTEQMIVQISITVISVVFAVGTFVGITKMSFKTVEVTLQNMQVQMQEIKDDQKMLSELSTRMSVGETRIANLEKCNDRMQSDLSILKKRNIKKIDD